MERVIEMGLQSLALAAAIGGFIFGVAFAVHTIMQENYKK